MCVVTDVVRNGQVFDVGTSIGIAMGGALFIILITTVIIVLIAVIFRFSSQRRWNLTLQIRNKEDTATEKYCNTKDGSIRNVELNGNDCYGVCDRPIIPEKNDYIYIDNNISYGLHKSGLEESDENQYTEIRTAILVDENNY